MHVLYSLNYTDDLADELVRIKEDVHPLELQAKVEQLIQTPPTVNILMTPEWVSLRTRLIYALDACPEARGSVLRALEGGGNGTA